MEFFEKLKALSYRARLTIVLHTVFTLAETIGGVFFNLYLWRLTSSLALIAQFQFFFWLAMMLGFILIGYAFKNKGMSQLFRIGFWLNFIFFCLIVWLGERSINWTVYLGLLSGLAAGFYWSAHEVMVLSGTSDKTREMFYGVLMSGESVARIAGPALSAGLIWLGAKWRGEALFGYYLLFAFVALLFLVTELAINRVKDVSFERFSLRGVFGLYQRKAWRWNLWRSFVDGLMISRWFVWGVLSYLILTSEVWLGTMMSLVGVLAIISNILIGQWFKPNLRARLNSWGAALLVIAGIAYPLLLNPLGLVFDQILGEIIGIPLFTFAWLAWFYLAVETDYDGKKRQFEYYAGHEIWQGIGRILSIGLFWLLASNLEQVNLARWWFGGLSLLFIVQWWLLKKVRTALVKAGYKEE